MDLIHNELPDLEQPVASTGVGDSALFLPGLIYVIIAGKEGGGPAL